jgi:hypothetical protein
MPAGDQTPGQIQKEGSVVSGVQTEFETLLLMHLTH